MTVVYVDSVFVLNTLMDYLLLSATAQLSGIELRRRRYLLSAVLGGGYAVSVFLPGCAFLGAWPIKIAAGILLALTAFGGEPRLARLVVLLFAVSCGFAGCVLGLGLLCGGGIPMANGIFYTNIDAKALVLAGGAAYVTLSVIFRASARHGGAGGALTPVTLGLEERRAKLTALCDSGNALRDPGTGRPMLVAYAGRVAALWPPDIRDILTQDALAQPSDLLERLQGKMGRPFFYLTPYRTVGNSGGLLLAFRCDWAVIGERRYERLLVALSPTELGDGFEALWGEEERGHGGVHKVGQVGASKAGAAAALQHPLHRGQRYTTRAPASGAGGGAVGETRRRGRPKNPD